MPSSSGQTCPERNPNGRSHQWRPPVKKCPSSTDVNRLIRWSGTAIGFLVVVLSVPLALHFTNLVSTKESWALTIPWLVGILAVEVTWLASCSRRRNELRSSVSLHVDLLPPERSRYHDSFELKYENRGTRDLEAAIDLYVYPSIRGRNEVWNPAFRKEFRDEITSLGPFESHDLLLGPREVQDYPYSRFSVLQACGLHGYTPHWLTLEASIWPRGMRYLVQTHTVHFYLLWFCGQEQRFPGSWLVEPIRIRARSHSEEAAVARWRKQFAMVVPDDYLEVHLQEYIDLKCKPGGPRESEDI